jgi:hypothetical protein
VTLIVTPVKLLLHLTVLFVEKTDTYHQPAHVSMEDMKTILANVLFVLNNVLLVPVMLLLVSLVLKTELTLQLVTVQN